MGRRAKCIVLDSWAALAYLGAEASGPKMVEIFAEARDSGTPMMMSVVNLAEVWYAFARRTSDARADEAVGDLKGLGIQIVPAEEAVAVDAAMFKKTKKMSLADCFAAALAKRLKGELVTGDQEFRQVEGEVGVRWI